MRHGKEGKVDNFDIWFNKQHRKKKEQKEGWLDWPQNQMVRLWKDVIKKKRGLNELNFIDTNLT